MPGGQYTNLKEQAEGMGLGARWHEIARTYAEVNLAFGDIVKVTPSSKVVGDMAIFLVTHGMTMQQFERLGPDHHLSHSEFGGRDVFRRAGNARRRLAQEIAAGDSAGTQAGARPSRRAAGRRSISTETAQAIEKKIGRRPEHDEVLSYLMYPDVFVKFARAQQTWDDVEVLPSPQFFFGMQKGEEITVDIEAGKRLVIKFLTLGEPHPDGRRTVFFELNGQPREVTVRDRSLKAHRRRTPEGRSRQSRPGRRATAGHDHDAWPSS